MRYLLILMAALVASCATKPPVAIPFVAKSKVERSADVSPAVSAVRKATADADSSGDVARARIETVKAEATSLREGLQAATAEADRLRKQKSATEQDLENMWASLNALTVRNLFLESEASKAAESLGHEKQLRRAAADALFQVESLARGKESEAQSLRIQLDDSEAQRQAIHKVTDDLSKTASEQQSRADKLAGEITIYRIVLGIVAVLLVLYVVFRVVVSRLP